MQELGEEHRIGWEGWGEEQQVLARAGDIIKGRAMANNRREGFEVLAKAGDIIKGRTVVYNSRVGLEVLAKAGDIIKGMIANRSWRWSSMFGRITLCLAGGGAQTARVVFTKM